MLVYYILYHTSIETACFGKRLLRQGDSHLENDATWIAICVQAFRRNVLPPIKDYEGNGLKRRYTCTSLHESHRRFYCHLSEKITPCSYAFTPMIFLLGHTQTAACLSTECRQLISNISVKPNTACEVAGIWLVNRVC